jgi:hypothetical protein
MTIHFEAMMPGPNFKTFGAHGTAVVIVIYYPELAAWCYAVFLDGIASTGTPI